jgi:AcrR family transcriptional regulator
MKSIPKLSGEERRAAIIKAVRRTFAEKGFVGATTRELADAAGVSEALLFKHFPNKEALYDAMLESCRDEQHVGAVERLNALEPSASTLVLMVHYLVSRVLTGCGSDDGDQTIATRMTLRSLAEDGDFARTMLRQLASCFIPKVEDSLRAAVAAGEAVDGPVLPAVGGWFTHHLAAMLTAHLMHEKPVVDYGLPCERLIEQTVWFALRGMGLKEQAIRRHYNPMALALFTR